MFVDSLSYSRGRYNTWIIIFLFFKILFINIIDFYFVYRKKSIIQILLIKHKTNSFFFILHTFISVLKLKTTANNKNKNMKYENLWPGFWKTDKCDRPEQQKALLVIWRINITTRCSLNSPSRVYSRRPLLEYWLVIFDVLHYVIRK